MHRRFLDAKYRLKRERTQRFQSQAYHSFAMWPFCDITSSDDDEHNTDTQFPSLVCGRCHYAHYARGPD